MATNVKYEDKLEGASSYLQWKVWITTVLKDNKLWTFANSTMVVLVSDPISLDLHEVKEAREQRIILMR